MDLSLCMCCENNMVETGAKCNQCTRFIQDAHSSTTAPSPLTGPITEDEIRAILMQGKPVTTYDLIVPFKSRLKCKEDKAAFAALLRRLSMIRKTNTANYVVLREREEKGTEMSIDLIEEMFTHLTLCMNAKPRKVKSPLTVKNKILPKVSSSSSRTAPGPAATGRVTTDEIRAVLLQRKQVTVQHLVIQFKSRLKCREDKAAFADILRNICKIQKTNTASYVVLRNRTN